MEDAKRIAQLFQSKYSEDPLRFSALPGVTRMWTPEKLVLLYQVVSAEQPLNAYEHEKFLKIVGMNNNSISQKKNRIDWEQFGEVLRQLCNMTIEDSVKYEAKKKVVKDNVVHKVKSRKQLIDREAFYTDLQEKILDASRTIKVHMPPVAFSHTPKTSEPEHVVLLLSDLHVGQEFRLEETGGINEYNIHIFQQRAKNLQKALGEIVQLHSKLYRMPELHIFALGDNVQGGRAAGEWGGAYTGHISVAEQAVLASKTIAAMINDWSRYFEKIHFIGLVGNHGRGGVSKETDEISASWDNVCYIALNGEMANNPKVDVKWTKTWWEQVNILGTEFMLVHGDYFNNSINAVLAANLKLHDLVAGMPQSKPFNVLCTGHFHRYTEIETNMGRILLNGSFVGGDMYSLQQMRATSRPTQTVFGVNRKHGITWRYPLDLETNRS